VRLLLLSLSCSRVYGDGVYLTPPRRPFGHCYPASCSCQTTCSEQHFRADALSLTQYAQMPFDAHACLLTRPPLMTPTIPTIPPTMTRHKAQYRSIPMSSLHWSQSLSHWPPRLIQTRKPCVKRLVGGDGRSGNGGKGYIFQSVQCSCFITHSCYLIS
jgi:hypothetical protein